MFYVGGRLIFSAFVIQFEQLLISFQRIHHIHAQIYVILNNFRFESAPQDLFENPLKTM